MNQHDNNAQGKSAPGQTDGHKYPLDAYSKKDNEGQGQKNDSPYYKSQAPSISLPKGGGALKGIDEKFTVNAENGTASLHVGLPITPGRGGFTPNLALQYNSGSGNSVFGLGWNLSLPSIQRRTDKKMPEYNDAVESDVFLLAGAEDLVPMLTDTGNVVTYSYNSSGGDTYTVKQYLPRMEGTFARIEYVVKDSGASSWWRVTTKDNIVTYYGLTPEGRIADPANAGRIFKWLPQFSVDRKGNIQKYEYVSEDTANVHVSSVHEYNRLNNIALFTNKYLKYVKYCNVDPYTIDSGELYEPSIPADPGYLMELVFDYGDHSTTENTGTSPYTYTIPYTPDSSWGCRKDPFSDFHAGFEIRTYRQCRRVLMFHTFSELTGSAGGVLTPVLVRSLDMVYQQDGGSDAFTEADYIVSFTSTGYVSAGTETYKKKSLPSVTCNYQALNWNTNIQNVSKADAENIPQGLTGPYQWIDLEGEGLPGVLTEQGNGWFYKHNLGDGHFSPNTQIAPKPSFAGLGSSLQWQDLDADGRRELVSHNDYAPGYFELDDDQEWQPFISFKDWVNVDWNSPYTKILDLNGDGRPDILITEERTWRWYENNGTEGYAIGGEASAALDENKGPRMLLNDMVQSIFLADMNGDGLTDIVRIQNGEVCYWPNMGYGRFGAKVTMSNAPRFDRPDQFNPVYITLADISGTGAPDIIYLGQNKCTAWINLAGNAWSAPTVISPLPGTDQYSKIAVMDFLGSGTSCIVWSSSLPQYANAPIRYIDLMGGNKPYLMTDYSNGMGKTTALTYKHSTKYYIEDKQAGTPWATKLPFPVHCVQQVTTSDLVSETTYSQSYTYHHGYYDHAEREFRGFGRVETTDTDVAKFYDNGTSTEDDLDQAPVLVKTWYHTGAWVQEGTLLDAFELEYYNNADWNLPGIASFPTGLNAQELREAHRALKTSPLRQEIYALDGTSQQGIPYSVTANSYIVKLVQHQFDNLYASFLTHQQENVVWHCERNSTDPRILHDLILDVDTYGNVLAAAKVAYPRSAAAIPSGTPTVVADAQQVMQVSYTVNSFTNDIIDSAPADNYHLRVPYETKAYQLHGLSTPTGLWQPADLKDAFDSITSGNEIDYATNPTTGVVQKRFLSHMRTLYLSDDTATVLNLGVLESLGLPYQKYQLALTDTIIYDAFGSLVTGAMLTSDGGYLREDTISYFSSTDTSKYWLPSGILQYNSSPYVASSFYTPIGFIDPWGNETTLTYWSNGTDNYYLLPATETDALSNTTTVNNYDFRCLQPTKITDHNENISEIVFDALCMPVAMALEGKGTGAEGDNITGLDPESATDISNQANFWTDPETYATSVLQEATWRCVYDLSATPTRVAMIGREVHYETDPGNTDTLITIVYTDGMGRVAMHKTQAANDPGTNAERWIGSGKTVYNNKGKVVLQYEPYFSTTFEYDHAFQSANAGVSPRMHYDPLGRVQKTELPDGSFTQTTWDAWMETAYDNNDTVNSSTWYTDRTTGPLSGISEEVDAAAKATEHNDTPTIIHLDTLAHPFYTIQQNRHVVSGTWVTDTPYESYVVMDILGNRLEVHDARGLQPLTYRHDMLKGVLLQKSIDSGNTQMLSDVAGQPLYSWDADVRQFHHRYDVLRRPTHKEVTISGSTKVLEVTIYGEGVSGATTYNLNGQVYQVYDGAGLTTIASYDFKGNPESKVRQFVTDYTTPPDWTSIGSVSMETDTYATYMAYDALNRPISILTPDHGTTNYTYQKAGQLYSVDVVNVRGLTSSIISSIIYNAKGQRLTVQERYQGGGGSVTNTTSTTYTYDPNTFRVTGIKTTRSSDNAILQDLKYWYDPVGNITKQEDGAQQTVYFNGSVASPDNDYTYDALYRLIISQGREHAGNNGAVTYNDAARSGFTPAQVSANDTAQMRTYIQYYTYDEVGNMLEMKHTTTGGTGNWTRDFTIDSSSNRTTASSIGSDGTHTESYTYNLRGGMIAGMNHLSNMAYNEQNQLVQVVDASGAIRTHYQYDAGGQRVRKVTIDAGSNIEKRRIYDGEWELYTHKTGGITDLTRETLHIMDDQARIALIDTPTLNTTGSGEVQLLRYQFSNHLSTATLELDFNAANVSYEEYYAFGSTSFQSGRSAAEVSLKRYRYTAKERDEETGLYYHGARYYAPWLCRWVAVDPLESKYSPQSPYVYCSDNPVNRVDPSGKGDEHPKTHTVKQGETLSGIAKEYKMNVSQLAAENHIADPNKIKVGQKLNLGHDNDNKASANVEIGTIISIGMGDLTPLYYGGMLPEVVVVGKKESGTKKSLNVKKRHHVVKHHLTIMDEVKNMMNDSETKHALDSASSATGISLENLMVMAIIESGGHKNVGTNRYGYTGLMQLGRSAIEDIQKKHPNITYEGVKNSVEMNALAGAIYMQMNSKKLEDKNISINVLHLYLAHQQGAGGLIKLLKTLKTNPTAPAIHVQLVNLPQRYIDEHHGAVTQQDFYNYWQNRVNNIQQNVQEYLKN